MRDKKATPPTMAGKLVYMRCAGDYRGRENDSGPTIGARARECARAVAREATRRIVFHYLNQGSSRLAVINVIFTRYFM